MMIEHHTTRINYSSLIIAKHRHDATTIFAMIDPSISPARPWQQPSERHPTKKKKKLSFPMAILRVEQLTLVMVWLLLIIHAH